MLVVGASGGYLCSIALPLPLLHYLLWWAAEPWHQSHGGAGGEGLKALPLLLNEVQDARQAELPTARWLWLRLGQQ